MANEPMAGTPLHGGARAQAVTAGLQFFKRLYERTRELDSSRPVTLVGV